MKTKILIEVETKNMNEFKDPTEDEEEVITENVEKALHDSFIRFFKELEEKDNELLDIFTKYLLNGDLNEEACCEGVEKLNDFGDIIIKVKQIKQ